MLNPILGQRNLLSVASNAFSFQVARNSHHRPVVVLSLPHLQVLDGVMVTLEERTSAELLGVETLVRPAHMHVHSEMYYTLTYAHTISKRFFQFEQMSEVCES